MTTEVMYEAITNISDRYIEEADPEAGNGFMSRVRRIRPVLNMAAALLVVLGLTAAGMHLDLGSRADEAAAGGEPAPEAAMEMKTMALMDAPAAEEEAAPAFVENDSMLRSDQPAAAMELQPEAETAEEAAITVEETLRDDHSVQSDAIETPEMPEPPRGTADAALMQGYPECIVWNGTQFAVFGDLLEELPQNCISAGVMERTEGAVFYSDSEEVIGMQVLVSADEGALYLAFEDGWVLYLK